MGKHHGNIPIPFKTFHFWEHSTYRDILHLGTSCLRGHSTSGDISSMGTHHLWGNTTTHLFLGIYHLLGHTIYEGIPHRLWGSTTYGDIPIPLKMSQLWGHLTYGDIPLLGNMGTYGDTPTFGKHHLRGHSTSGDTPSMGDILPTGTFHF